MTVPIHAAAPIGLADQIKPEPVLVATAPASAGGGNSLSSGVTQTFNRFGQEVQRMDASSGPGAIAHDNFNNIHFEISSGASKSAAKPLFKPQLALMLQTFDMSINTELVSRAVSEFTGSVNTLVKTQ